MTFKPNAIKRTVTATLQKPDGSPSQGKIVIKLSEPVLGRQENTIYTRQGVEIELDATGSFSRELAVTSPGLTTEEQAELTSIQAQITTEAAQMVTTQGRINAYLKKIYDNVTVTPADVLDHKNDLALKKSLQESASVLKKREKVFLDKQKKLQEAAVIMAIEFHLINPKEKSKIFLVVPSGTGPIDIADLPRE